MAAVSSVVLYDPRDTSPEVRTIARFLAGYSGRTREAYTLDLRMFYRWCEEHHLALFEITRTHIKALRAQTRGTRSSRRHHRATPLHLGGLLPVRG